ncbi:MAG: DNA-directed RNA polymerase subunit alpha [Candidatus Shikimatogenerans bostrichidophilus]|nr:MAG: DNA-directed RNA polymerase subunit alpha [Candidatus Shikimatogenerans bostrichidophilus]
MGIKKKSKSIKILILKNTNNIGIFKLFYLNSGFGITIGNSLRRVLLSSLYGYAISYFKINNIKHEFTSIKGIIEDVTEIVLKLKQIRFKIKNIKEKNITKEKIKININSKIKKIYAGYIDKFSKYFEVINKDLIICNKEKNVKLKIYLIVNKGKGYVDSEHKKKYKDFISIDSFYTPIIKVSFKIKNIDINNYENEEELEILKIKILTDGSIKPINALIKSSKILIKIFNIFYKKKKFYIYKNKNKNKNKNDIKKYDDNYLKIKKILNTKLNTENFSVRTINCLNNYKIYTWKDLVILKKIDLLNIKNFGKKSLKELIDKMKKKKLKFEMNIK